MGVGLGDVLGMGLLGVSRQTLQLLQALLLRGLLGRHPRQVRVAIRKRRLEVLEGVLSQLELLRLRGLFFLELFQAAFRLAAVLGGLPHFGKRTIPSCLSLDGFLLALHNGGVGLDLGLLGARVKVVPPQGELQALPDAALFGVQKVYTEPVSCDLSISPCPSPNQPVVVHERKSLMRGQCLRTRYHHCQKGPNIFYLGRRGLRTFPHVRRALGG